MKLAPLAALLAAAVCHAQQAAPAPDSGGPAVTEGRQEYDVTSSLETGYRFSTVSGNQAEYRSMVNFGDGIRLLNGFLGANSKDGNGRLFDNFSLSLEGLGDPYESATLRVGKNRWYRYDLIWRRNDYVNPGLASGGAIPQHPLDTTYAMQDHDLTLRPESNVRFLFGYSHVAVNGPAISTVPAFDAADTFPVFSNVRWVTNEYRAGNEIRFRGLVLNWVRGWENFKDDGSLPGPVPSPGALLAGFQAAGPNHGTSPYWRVSLLYKHKMFAINGRFTSTDGQRAYAAQENAAGTVVAAAATRQIISLGDAQRPVATGNLNLSFTPTARISAVNQTSLYNIRTEGNNAYAELDGSQLTRFLYFEYLGIRTFANRSDVIFHAKRWLALHGGYEYSQRRIRSIEQTSFGGPLAGAPFDLNNHDHLGLFGVALTGMRGLTASVEGQVGRGDAPLTPKSDGAWEAVAARVLYRTKTLTLGASSSVDRNNNSVSLTAFSSRSHSYSGTASWAMRPWLSLDATYSKLYLRALGGLEYFASAQPVSGDQSYYLSNIHSGTFGVRFARGKGISAFVGYSIVDDAGDSRAAPIGAGTASSLPALQAAQTFPLRFQSPLGRVSIRLAGGVHLNLGYERYGYGEPFFASQGFRANTGYAGLLWTF